MFHIQMKNSVALYKIYMSLRCTFENDIPKQIDPGNLISKNRLGRKTRGNKDNHVNYTVKTNM